MSKFVTTTNGNLIWKSKEPPPKELEGYDVDPMDDKVFIPRWPKCIYREEKKMKLPCGRLRDGKYCSLKNLPFLVLSGCVGCKERVAEVIPLQMTNSPENQDDTL